MKINWKEACKSPGYISLKKQLLRYSQTKSKYDKPEALRHFKWIIARATHYAFHLNKTFEEVINEWEEKRTYCWYNFYQDFRQPKLNKSELVKPKSVKTAVKLDYSYRNDPGGRKKRVLFAIMKLQEKNSKRKGKKARWFDGRKKDRKSRARLKRP